MVLITIDNRAVEVEDGATVLEAAAKAGVEVPTLCHLPGKPAQTSCLVCVVRVQGMARLVPACATRVRDGMVVESDTEEVRAARRTAIELLLSDHLGDCMGPCQGVCPAHMDMPLMLRQIAAGRYRDALITVKERIALPAVLGRICPELCEKGCRRGAADGPVAVCLLKRFVADVDLASDEPYLPPCRPASGKRVAIVGTGPAGLSAAYYLLQQGHACTLFDDHDAPGGMLRYGVSRDALPLDALDAEIGLIERLGARFELGRRVGTDPTLEQLRLEYDAVLLAVGDVKGEAAAALGLATAGSGLKVDRRTMMTATSGVFAAGSALAPSRHAVRAVADGRSAALAIEPYLAAGTGARPEKEWSVHVGRLDGEEVQPYVRVASPAPRRAPSAGRNAGFTEEEARQEAMRCLHCDCRKPEGCKLREYAVEYDASAQRFKGERRPFEQDGTHPEVLFEAGKCIACGICVQIAAERREKLGLAFIGRGFTVRTAVPFGEPLAEGLREAARACAAACPTGALALREGEDG